MRLVVAAVLLLAWSSARALPGPVPSSVSLGNSIQEVRKACASLKGVVEELDAVVPQQLADGLVRSGLLVMLNRSGAKHSLLERPGERGVVFLRATAEGKVLLFAFAGGKLEAVLARVTVAPDREVSGGGNPFEPRRLDPIKAFLGGMKKQCGLKPRDKGENHFVFTGRCGASVYLEYRPEDDEFAVLYHR